jgi:phage shock protein C
MAANSSEWAGLKDGLKYMADSIARPAGTPRPGISYLHMSEVKTMFCTRCGIEIDEKVRYCSACGHPTKLAEATANPYASPRLALDTENKKIAGVCAGFARYLGVDALLIRIVWLALVLGAGFGCAAYVIAWILMPKDAPRPAAAVDYARQGG